MTVKLSDVRAFCFDFDGVFYGYNQTHGIDELCDIIMAQTAHRIIGDTLDLKTAENLARTGYNTHGDCITAFCEWATQQGINPEGFKLKLFQQYHDNLRRTLANSFPNIFSDRTDLKLAFQLSQGRAINGVATHSCATNWAKPFLASMGISEYFSMQAVHGLDESSFTLKHNDPRLIEMSFSSMGVQPENGCFIEDTARNLRAMKERHPQTRCILIHQGTPLEQQPSYVDDQFATILDMKIAYAAQLQDKPRIITLG